MPYVTRLSGVFVLFVICSVRLESGVNSKNCECGVTNRAWNRITGGSNARWHEFPWLVIISNTGVLYCSGTLINDLYVLTAGHCIRWTVISNIKLFFGQHNRKKSNNYYLAIEKMVLHQDFYSHYEFDENDIALIKLKSRVKFTTSVSPICLPLPDSMYDDKWAIIAGWGQLKQKGNTSSILQQSSVKVLSKQECANTPMKEFIRNHNMCAYFKSRDTCKGDSGGPLMFDSDSGPLEIIGIVSWGFGCGKDNTPGIYTRVTYYLDWIYQHTQDASYCNGDDYYRFYT